MAYATSPLQTDAMEELIISLRVHIRYNGGIPVAAKQTGMVRTDLASVLRLDRPVSMSKLMEIGDKLGLEIAMKWVPKNGKI